MILLGIDIGSSSVKAAILRGTRIQGSVEQHAFLTRFDGVRAEVDSQTLLKQVAVAICALADRVRRVDAIALSVMSPAWVAMNAKGEALTPIVTHQDRRSVEVARQIEARVGKSRHLRLAGNRPFPGSISSTTFAWYLKHERDRLRKLDLIGHFSTFVIRQFTGERVIDPSNASFTGLYRVPTQGGWSEELCDAIGVSKQVLPAILESDQIAGKITRSAARRFGLTEGTPMLAGIIDTSAAMLLAKPTAGRLLNVSGSTDVLMVCMPKPKPQERLLTRALGVGPWWMSVATIAAAGSTFSWMREQFFLDLGERAFWKLVNQQSKRCEANGVEFEPYLAGERASIEQRRGAFAGLTMSSTREHLLCAAIDALARASAERLPLLAGLGQPIDHRIVTSGGTHKSLGGVLHRDWPGKWTFTREDNATLRGLGTLTPRAG